MNYKEILIRPENPDDYDVVYNTNKRAFKQDDEARLVEKIRKSSSYIPKLSLVAEKKGEIIGHILFSVIKIKAGGDAVPILSLAPMAVLPEYQRQGVGSLLVRKGLEEAKRFGYKIVVVVGHPDYYPRFGFAPAKGKGIKLPFNAPDEAFLGYELIPKALEEVTGVLEYPAEFEEFI